MNPQSAIRDSRITVLLITDDAECTDTLREMLSQEHAPSFDVERVDRLRVGLEQLANQKFDVILLDLCLPDTHGLEALETLYAQVPEIPIIVLTSQVDESRALDTLRKGAQEYLIKGALHGKMLSRVMRYAIEREQAEQVLRASEACLRAEKAQAEYLAKELERVVRELKETQEEMLRRENALATGDLAAVVAHEIRNPLSIISMSVQYLQSKFDQQDPRREFAEAIIRKVQQLDSITKRLISYGRHRELRLVRRNVSQCLNRAFSLVKPLCQAHGIITVRRYSRKIPLGMVDEEMTDELFTNLLTNAVDAMPRGGRLTLETTVDQERHEAVIKISDTGCGIPLEHREQLFKPFFSTKKDGGGSGLGLAISQRIVTDHGGTIAVDSRHTGVHRGTAVTIRLPVQGPRVLPVSTVPQHAVLTEAAGVEK